MKDNFTFENQLRVYAWKLSVKVKNELFSMNFEGHCAWCTKTGSVTQRVIEGHQIVV